MTLDATPTEPRDVGPVELALTASRLRAVVNKMTNTLFRTGRSGVLNTARDFSCCIVSAEHELVMAADSLPIHVMSGPELITAAVTEHHPTMRRGDAFLHNSPYEGNSHAADHVIVVPVFDDTERHRCSVLVKAHQADCGNAEPTTYSAAAADVYEEGALIFSAVQVQRDGADIDDIIRLCRNRIRVPDQWHGDYLAMTGAARIGEADLVRLGRETGWDRLDEIIEAWQRYGQRSMRDALGAIPRGRVRAMTLHDPFPGAPEGIPITATVDVGDDHCVIDLTENADCLPCGLNLTESTARTSALIGLFNSIDANVPTNAGAFRDIEVRLREGCVAGIPTFPHSASVATTNVADRVIGAVQLAFAELSGHVGMAECGAPLPGSAAVVSGVDSAGTPYVNQLFLATTGGAAGPNSDGRTTLCHAGNAGMLYLDSVEIDESRFPIRIETQMLLPDTEGPGRFVGAPAALVEYGPTTMPMRVMFSCDGSISPARGARGGGEGRLAAHHVRRGGELQVAPRVSGLVLDPGETLVVETSGGGGFGDPRERSPALVAEAVASGLLSTARARCVYGYEPGATDATTDAPTDATTDEHGGG